MKNVVISDEAARALRKHRNVSAKILAKIEAYAQEGRSNMVTKLVGSDAQRLRVGDFRVIFQEDATTIRVLKIAPRGEAY